MSSQSNTVAHRVGAFVALALLAGLFTWAQLSQPGTEPPQLIIPERFQDDASVNELKNAAEMMRALGQSMSTMKEE